MRKILRMWEYLKEIGPPPLRDDVELEFKLALLDFYMIPCIEEFIESGGTLSPSTIVHLRTCKRGLAPLLKKLDGWILSYFEKLLRLSREVLRRVRVKEALLIVRCDAEREIEEFFSWADGPLFSDLQTEKCAFVKGESAPLAEQS
jgi:hypothetical protein